MKYLGVGRLGVIVIISMMMLCSAIVIIEYDRRRSARLPSTSLDMDYDNNSIEEYSSEHQHRLSIL